jgi:hypothetical protein
MKHGAEMNLLSRLFGRKTERTIPLNRPTGLLDHPDFSLKTAQLKSQLHEALKAKAVAERRAEQLQRPVRFTPGKDFVCVLPFCAADAMRFFDLLNWMRELGGVKGIALMVAPAGMRDEVIEDARRFARGIFEDVGVLRTPFDLPKEGWPTGTCWSFLVAAEHCRRHQLDFWLNEPDCIPLKPGWFEAIRAEYRQCGLPYMGFVEPATPDYPEHLTGNAAYHHSVFHHFRADKLGTAWDIAMADVLTPQAHRTRLFHQEFGPLDRPPTFHTVDDLRRIPKDAVVFHRNKDGSLIKVLREQRESEQRSREGAKTEAMA